MIVKPFYYSCEVEPKSLGELVLSLLSNDFDDTYEHQDYCIAELKDFLKNKSESFVALLFQTLRGFLFLKLQTCNLFNCSIFSKQYTKMKVILMDKLWKMNTRRFALSHKLF